MRDRPETLTERVLRKILRRVDFTTCPFVVRVVEELDAEGSLDGYHLLRSVRGDLLAKLDRAEEARQEFERAAAMTENARERELLLQRARIVGA